MIYKIQFILVPLSEKRHRLYSHEIPEVIQGLLLRLEKLIKINDEEKAKITFRTLYRLIFSQKGGRPKYPQFTWSDANAMVAQFKDDYQNSGLSA
jgi:hypothetical protein